MCCLGGRSLLWSRGSLHWNTVLSGMCQLNILLSIVYCHKSEDIKTSKGLDPYILNRNFAIRTSFGFKSVFRIDTRNYGTESIRTQVNSVLKPIRTHLGQFVLSFRSICTHLFRFSQLVLILVDSYSVWSICTHTKDIIW